MAHETIGIFGKHAVTEALLHMPSAVEEVYTAQHFDDPDLLKLIAKRKLRPGDFKKGSSLVPHDVVHQGIIAKVDAHQLVKQYKDFIEGVEATPDTLFIILDELQDPQNVGSIIRSAAAFGVAAILIPTNNQAPITGAVVKVSAGMAFRVPLVGIGNVNQIIRDLKERGFWIYGLAGEGSTPIMNEKFDAASVLVVGNEGEGIRKLTREHCDILLSIPMDERCESLNAGVSTAVALYAWSTKHQRVLK